MSSLQQDVHFIIKSVFVNLLPFARRDSCSEVMGQVWYYRSAASKLPLVPDQYNLGMCLVASHSPTSNLVVACMHHT